MLNLKYQTTVRYFFALLVVGTIFLGRLKFLSSFLEYFLLAIILLGASFLILFKKYYFISNLISNSSTTLSEFEVKLGQITGLITLVISFVFFWLSFKNK